MQLEILWDASPLWGPLLLNAIGHYARERGLTYGVSSGRDIAQRGVRGRVLLVPGGSARHKMLALGEAGAAAVRNFMAEGGAYLGFCGGAGLALSEHLGLCPWGRSACQERMQHLVSGHIESDVLGGDYCPAGMKTAQLPVWWPGRFEESSFNGSVRAGGWGPCGPVRVLARYRTAGKDLNVGDLPVCDLSQTDLDDWSALYGVNIRPTLLDGQPAAVSGSYGKGVYVLSYSHFETPDSPDANCFLGAALRGLSDAAGADSLSFARPLDIPDPFRQAGERTRERAGEDVGEGLAFCDDYEGLERLFALGARLNLLFPRTPWLYGWRASIPGSQLNALRMSLRLALDREKSGFSLKQAACLREKGDKFHALMNLFLQGARGWLLARRLAESMGDSEAVSREILSKQRRELFGMPMVAGGLCGELTDFLDSLMVD